ncbi:F-box protein At5g49610-like [Nymphaea colorata]|nr:F-box protein At5g49610-like [Nymphaea colorata]
MANEAAEMASPSDEEAEEREDGATLPSQILVDEILSRLPVKTLLRLRLVCRSWRSLVDHDEHFIAIHLARSRNATKILKETRRKVHLLDNEGRPPLEKGDNQFFPMHNFSIRSSCDGLLCLEAVDGREHLHVANLAMRQCVTLPVHSRPDLKARICELIRDPLSGLYKLLIVQWNGSASYSEIMTLCKDSSWRKLDIAIQVSGAWAFGVSHPRVSGAAHWTNGFSSTGCILAFDISDEKFRTMVYPECRCRESSCNGLPMCRHLVCLVELDGFLHVLHFDSLCTTMEMWVMKDYSNGIWSREYELRVGFIPGELQTGLIRIDPVSVIGGEILLWVSSAYTQRQYLVLYHPEQRNFHPFKQEELQLENGVNGVSPYVDSLVCLKQLALPRVANFGPHLAASHCKC